MLTLIQICLQRKMSTLDLYFFAAQPMNFLSILLYINSISGKRDGLYWLLEDILPSQIERSSTLNTVIFVTKSIILIPCFCHTCRAMQFTSLAYLSAVTSTKELAYTLLHKIKVQSIFFRYYAQFYIICGILRQGFERATLIALTMLYVMFIQTTWACVVGIGKLEISVYMMFAMPALTVVVGLAILLPLISSTAELTNSIPKIKLQETKAQYCTRASFNNRLNVKKAKALQPVKLRFSVFHPLGKDFSRGMIQNMIDNLLQLVLTFDLNGNQI